MNYKIIPMKVMGDERGKLVAIENNKNIPFEIKRVYYIFDTLPDQDRGKHAHKRADQLLIAIDGCCEMVLYDGHEKVNVKLNRPDIGLYVDKGIWGELKNFSYGCKLMVLASEHYDESEYIRNYDEFIRMQNI